MPPEPTISNMMDDRLLAMRIRRWREAIDDADRFFREQEKRLAEIRAMDRSSR